MSSILRSRSASARSLVFSTVSMPFSICSIDVADAQRLARGAGDRERGRVERRRVEVARLGRVVARRPRGQQPLGDARDRRGEEDERERERDVEGEVEQHDLAAPDRAPAPSIQRLDVRRRAASASTQPISLNRKLPSVTRRASGGERSVDSMPRRPLPRLAPSTRPSATGSAITLSEASAATQQHDGEARVAEHREQRGDQHVEQHVAGERGEDHLDAGRLRRPACAATHDPLQREDDEAEADQDAPEAADRSSPAARGTARRRRRSAAATSHDRSNDSTTVTSDVPTSAPSITASAGAVPIRPWPANAATISAVAVLLWISAGDADAGEERGDAVVDAVAQQAPQVAAVEAQDAGAHDVRAPDEQRHAGEEVEQRLHASGGAGFDGGERRVEDRRTRRRDRPAR